MLTKPTESQLNVVLEIANSVDPMRSETLELLLPNMHTKVLREGDALINQGERNNAEYFLTEGVLRSFVVNPEGDEVTLAFSTGPEILSPSIARCLDGYSLVSCHALTSATVVSLRNNELIELMVSNPEVQRWGDAVMRAELLRRTQREIGLVTKTAKQRLSQFRALYPTLEDQVPHHMIASYLGITPVTLSRLRNG